MFLAAQLIGIGTIILTIAGLFCKNKYNILLFMTLSNVFMLVTYLLLGRYLGCLMVCGATLRTFIYFIYAKLNKKPQFIFVLFFEVYFVLVSLFLWKDFKDLFMLANLCLLTYTTWQDNMTVFRIGYIFSSVFLITYDICVGAYVTCVSEVIMLAVSVWMLIKYDFVNRIHDLVEHFYTTIAPSYEIKIEKINGGCYIISEIVTDEYNNFCYLSSPSELEANMKDIRKKFALENRKPVVYFQSVDNKSINEIMAFGKNHKLIFHDCWMKLRTGSQSKTKKCRLEGVTFRPATEQDAKELLEVFKLGFIENLENEVYKFSQDYYDKYKKIFENNALKTYNIYPYIAHYKKEPVAVLFIYTKGTNAYICQITTIKKYRRNGIASSLISYSIQNQRKHGIEDFYLVTEKYTYLETFYMKNNFEEVSQGFCYNINKKPKRKAAPNEEEIS